MGVRLEWSECGVTQREEEWIVIDIDPNRVECLSLPNNQGGDGNGVVIFA